MKEHDEMLELVIFDVSKGIRRICNRIFRDSDVSAQQGGILMLLDRLGPLSQVDIADQLDTSSAAIAAVLTRMELAGLISRAAGNNDRRVRIVSLTPESNAIVSRLHEQTFQLGECLRVNTDHDGRRTTAKVLSQFRNNLRELEKNMTESL